MDPNTRGPEEHGHEGEGTAPRPRPPRDPLTPELAQIAAAPVRTTRLVTGEHLLTVNPVDGSEIETCPPAERPGRARKADAAERAEAERAAKPPAPAGPQAPALYLPARQEEREQLVRLLARGRSVRLLGPSGSGRTSLLDLVAEDCADLAPDGVVRLNGFHRTVDDLLHALFHAVHHAPGHRPDRVELLEYVREIGAVVVVDDLELGGAALDLLLDATPECAFLLAPAPDAPAPSPEAGLEEVVLGGLDRAAGEELLERGVGRSLTEEETNWAGDLWFESEGLPLRFVQAGALLRQRDRLRAETDAFDEYGVFEGVHVDGPVESADAEDVPMPTLAEGAAPAALLASRLSPSAREALRFAVALDGEVPHQAHLPALVGDTHADAALGELVSCALVTPVGSRYRLASGVRTQLEAAGYADDAPAKVRGAARHYAWWAAHPSVTPERVCAEADAVLAALAAVVPGTVPPAGTGEGGELEEVLSLSLARAAAPAFAAGLHWSAWERALRLGVEAARLAGQDADQAYFHHELGVLALCNGELDVARAQLETALGIRAALADKRGTVSARRALALVADRESAPLALAAPAGEEVPDARHEESQSPPAGIPLALPPGPSAVETTLVTHRPEPEPARGFLGGLRGLARRNLVAAGSGALLAAVLGTVVTLGATSDRDPDAPSDRVGPNPSATQGIDDGSLDADAPSGDDRDADVGSATSRPTDPGPDGTPGTSDDPIPSGNPTSAEPSDEPSGTGRGSTRPGDSASPSRPSSGSRPPSTSPRPSTSTPSAPSTSPGDTSPSPDPTEEPPGDDDGPPVTAGSPVSDTPASSAASTGDTGTGTPGDPAPDVI